MLLAKQLLLFLKVSVSTHKLKNYYSEIDVT